MQHLIFQLIITVHLHIKHNGIKSYYWWIATLFTAVTYASSLLAPTPVGMQSCLQFCTLRMNFVHCFASFLQIFSLFVFPPSPSLFIPILILSASIWSDAQIKALLTFEMKPVSRLNSNYSHFKIHLNDSHLISLV